jgi:hypothetical protein|nr:MAG TPA: hypothetical protein [Caudoviricetes sp.]
MEVNENYFMFNHICYRAEEVKENGRSKCSRCAFREHRECDYWYDIPECSEECRKDGRSVVFVEAKRNFEKITASPEALANFLVYRVGDLWFGCTSMKENRSFDSRGEAIAATQEWLEREVEE